MPIHTVRKSFICRDDQFGHGREPVVGIDLNTLKKHEVYQFKMGSNPVIYECAVSEIVKIAFIWTNKEGKEVAIVPLRLFTIKE